VGDVVRALHSEPPPSVAPCCGIDELWLTLGAQVRERLDHTTIADLARA
jgi:DNA-binding IscR family transcriptional regulator